METKYDWSLAPADASLIATQRDKTVIVFKGNITNSDVCAYDGFLEGYWGGKDEFCRNSKNWSVEVAWADSFLLMNGQFLGNPYGITPYEGDWKDSLEQRPVEKNQEKIMNAPVQHSGQNPFAVAAPTTQAMSTVQSDSQRAIAEVQAALVIAKQFPRNPIEAYDRIMNACQRPGLAQSAVYSYARGGSSVTGPSIRLAEMLAQNWGNIQYGIRELSSENGESTVEAFAWDVETNTRQTKVFQVPHIRYTRNGSKKLTDPRDIYELVANNGARRLRACILGVIPGDVIDDAVNQCEKTIHASADTSPEAVQKLVVAFEQFNVTKKDIEDYIQRRLDAITAANIVALRKIFTSLRDGMSSPKDWFKNVTVKEVGEVQEVKPTVPDNEFPVLLEQIKADAVTKEYVLEGYALTNAQIAEVNAL